MKAAEPTFNLMPGPNVAWIGLCSLHHYLNPIRSRKSEITGNDRTCEIVQLLECVLLRQMLQRLAENATRVLSEPDRMI